MEKSDNWCALLHSIALTAVALEHCTGANQEFQQQVTWWPAVSSLTTCDEELDTKTGEWQSNKGDYTILVIVVITINIVIVIVISIKQQSKKQLNNSLTPPQIHHDHHLRQTYTQSLGLDVLSF